MGQRLHRLGIEVEAGKRRAQADRSI